MSLSMCQIIKWEHNYSVFGQKVRSTKKTYHVPIHRYMPGMREPTHAVFPLLSPKCLTNASRNMPKEKQTPSTMTFVTREDTTTTHPHPPSGGNSGDVGSSQASPPPDRLATSSRLRLFDFSAAMFWVAHRSAIRIFPVPFRTSRNQ